MTTIRLTMAQALIRYVAAQTSEVDDREVPLLAGALTLIRWLINSGACTRASLKILRLPLLFSRYLSLTAPTAVTGWLSSDRQLSPVL